MKDINQPPNSRYCYLGHLFQRRLRVLDGNMQDRFDARSDRGRIWSELPPSNHISTIWFIPLTHMKVRRMIRSPSLRLFTQSSRFGLKISGAFTRALPPGRLRNVSTYNADVAGLTEEQTEASHLIYRHFVFDS